MLDRPAVSLSNFPAANCQLTRSGLLIHAPVVTESGRAPSVPMSSPLPGGLPHRGCRGEGRVPRQCGWAPAAARVQVHRRGHRRRHWAGRGEGQLRNTGERSPVAIVLVQHHGRVTGSCSRVTHPGVHRRNDRASPSPALPRAGARSVGTAGHRPYTDDARSPTRETTAAPAGPHCRRSCPPNSVKATPNLSGSQRTPAQPWWSPREVTTTAEESPSLRVPLPRASGPTRRAAAASRPRTSASERSPQRSARPEGRIRLRRGLSRWCGSQAPRRDRQASKG